MDLRRSEWIPDRVTFSLIELPVDTGRRGYMDCVRINIGCLCINTHGIAAACDNVQWPQPCTRIQIRAGV